MPRDSAIDVVRDLPHPAALVPIALGILCLSGIMDVLVALEKSYRIITEYILSKN